MGVFPTLELFPNDLLLVSFGLGLTSSVFSSESFSEIFLLGDINDDVEFLEVVLLFIRELAGLLSTLELNEFCASFDKSKTSVSKSAGSVKHNVFENLIIYSVNISY